MTGRHSPVNGATSAPHPPAAPDTHSDGPQRSTAHRSTSPGWHWTDLVLIAIPLAGLAAMIAALIYALTVPVGGVVHYEAIPVRTQGTTQQWLPGPSPLLPAPIPMVVAQLDDPRAHVLVPAWPAGVIR